jgi:hypothetical protein
MDICLFFINEYTILGKLSGKYYIVCSSYSEGMAE